MATNFIYEGDQITIAVPSGTDSGDPLVINSVAMVALEDRNTAGYATCRLKGVFDLSVKAVNDGGNSLVAIGDTIFYVTSDTPVLSTKASGQPFGKAMEVITTAGATATIQVALLPPQVEEPESVGTGTKCNFDTNPVTSAVGGGVAHATATNVMTLDGINFEYDPLGSQAITAPSLVATGLNVSMDQANDDGVIICRGITAKNPESFVVGTSPAFYAKLRFSIATVAGTDDCAFGFVAATSYPANLDDFTDAALLNVISGNITIETILNNVGTVTTDTLVNWLDTETHELGVFVSSAGVVTYTIDGVTPGTLPAAAFTFDTGDRVFPCFFFLHAVGIAGAVTLIDWESGLQ